MLKQAIILTFITTLLAGCVTGPEDYLKRSANNKLFDRKGFKGGKRAPLYNKKYISQAKKNILTNNLPEDMEDEEDSDELYEEQNISRENIEMYKEMILEDKERARKKKNKSSWWSSRNKKQSYPSLSNASDRIDPTIHAQNLELKEELEQIKSMLNDTKREMASYKCPTADEQEKKSKKTMKEKVPSKTTLDRTVPKNLSQPKNESTQNKHIQSI